MENISSEDRYWTCLLGSTQKVGRRKQNLASHPDWESLRDSQGRSALMAILDMGDSVLFPMIATRRAIQKSDGYDHLGRNLWFYYAIGAGAHTQEEMRVLDRMSTAMGSPVSKDGLGIGLQILLDGQRWEKAQCHQGFDKIIERMVELHDPWGGPAEMVDRAARAWLDLALHTPGLNAKEEDVHTSNMADFLGAIAAARPPLDPYLATACQVGAWSTSLGYANDEEDFMARYQPGYLTALDLSAIREYALHMDETSGDKFKSFSAMAQVAEIEAGLHAGTPSAAGRAKRRL